MTRRVTMFCLLVVLTMSLMSCTCCKRKPLGEVNPPVAKTTEEAPPVERPAVPAEGPFSSAGYLEVVYFDFDKYNIRPDQMKNAEGDAKWMVDHADMKVLIEGHCDERGTVEYNLGLGSRRANTMRDFMVKRGVKSESISVISKGKEEPADPGHDEADEFKFLTKPPTQ